MNTVLFYVLYGCPFFFFTEILDKCKGDLLEMKGSKLKTHPSLLENLVFFVEVNTFSL